MKHPIDTDAIGAFHKVFYPAIVAAIALAAILSTYFLANSSLAVESKTRGFSGIIAVFLIVTVGLHLWQYRRERARRQTDEEGSVDIESSLSGLDEAKDLFAGSLAPGDAFRLAASRIRGLVPCTTIVLYVPQDSGRSLTAMQAEGSGAESYRGTTVGSGEGQPGECYHLRTLRIDQRSVAIPLESSMATFGVLQLQFDKDFDARKVEPSTFEAIGSRTAPLLLSSVAFEQSQTTALTDNTTDLPNERALHLVLENQIAESQRKRDERPLTVLALDVRGFDDMNQRFGHAAGDRVLAFVAEVVGDNLRQMDFFARATADEFLAVLPTATKEISHDIIARIQTGFFGRKLKITDADSVEVEINVGWAAFGTDGETPDTLLRVARARKDQSKSIAPPKVLWFPGDFAN